MCYVFCVAQKKNVICNKAVKIKNIKFMSKGKWAADLGITFLSLLNCMRFALIFIKHIFVCRKLIRKLKYKIDGGFREMDKFGYF